MLPMLRGPETLSGIGDLALATGISVAWASIIGSAPTVVNQGDYYEIIFNPDQEEAAANWILAQLRKEPGAVRLDASGIATKVISRKYWPWILGLVVVGGVAGYAWRGSR